MVHIVVTHYTFAARRIALRKTWFPSDASLLRRLEVEHGVVIRFVVGAPPVAVQAAQAAAALVRAGGGGGSGGTAGLIMSRRQAIGGGGKAFGASQTAASGLLSGLEGTGGAELDLERAAGAGAAAAGVAGSPLLGGGGWGEVDQEAEAFPGSFMRLENFTASPLVPRA